MPHHCAGQLATGFGQFAADRRLEYAPDTVHLDFSAGGFFVLPGGIDLSGLSGGVDQLKVTGVAGGAASHTPPALRGGLPQFSFKSGSESIVLRYGAFEDITVTQWQTFSAANRFDIGAVTWRITTTDRYS